MPIVRLLKPLLVCVLLMAVQAAAHGQLLPDEESARFMDRIKAGLTGRNVDAMLKEVWWSGADAQSRTSLKAAFDQLIQLHLASIKFRALGPEDELLNQKDSELETALPVRSILSIELSPVPNPEPDGTFLFEYPVGVSDGKVWILPVLDRAKK